MDPTLVKSFTARIEFLPKPVVIDIATKKVILVLSITYVQYCTLYSLIIRSKAFWINILLY